MLQLSCFASKRHKHGQHGAALAGGLQAHGRRAVRAAGYPNDSMWHGLDIEERVRVEWGRHSLVDATKALLRKVLSWLQ